MLCFLTLRYICYPISLLDYRHDSLLVIHNSITRRPIQEDSMHVLYVSAQLADLI